MLSIWAKTSGTWVNVATVLVGSGVGLLLGNRLPRQAQQVITQALGLLTLVIGFRLSGAVFEVEAGPLDGVIVALLALAVGGLLGEWWRIEVRLTQLGDWLKQRVQGGGRFTEGFIASSLLFCIGPLTVIGSLNNGISGDDTLLVLKAAMDGLAAIAFAGIYGVGVGFSALSVLVVQGSLSLAAGLLAVAIPDPATDPAVTLTTGIGGMLILAIALGLLDVAKLRLASFLPALVVGPLVLRLAEWLF